MGLRGISGQELRSLSPPTSVPDTRRAPPKLDGEPDTVSPAPPEFSKPKEETAVRQAIQRTPPEAPSRPRRSGTRLYVDPNVNRIVAQIVDENNEVIKQIPPEELLKIAAKFRELTGLLFEKRV